MNYEKLYNSLIDSRKKLNRKKKFGTYYESHHILPKSLGGSNNKDNLILLTPKEHFVAHLLLWKYTKTLQMTHALFFMSSNKKGKLSAKSYSILREQYAIDRTSQMSGENAPMFGKKHSEETKRKMRLSRKGQIFTDETKKKMSIGRSGILHTEETKRKMSESKKGKPGTKHTEESKRKMSESSMGIKHTDEAKRKMSLARKGKPWHGNSTVEGLERMRQSKLGSVSWNKKITYFDKVMNIKQVAELNTVTVKDIKEVYWLFN